MAQPQFSSAVQAARNRRGARAASDAARDEWFIDQVMKNINLTLKQRLTVATSYLRDKIVKNISVPVTKQVITTAAGTSATVVTERSKPGEYPRADTTLLMKTIMQDVVQPSPNIIDGIVGTPVDYGVRLELDKALKRSYFRRTLLEQLPSLRRMFARQLI